MRCFSLNQVLLWLNTQSFDFAVMAAPYTVVITQALGYGLSLHSLRGRVDNLVREPVHLDVNADMPLRRW